MVRSVDHGNCDAGKLHRSSLDGRSYRREDSCSDGRHNGGEEEEEEEEEEGLHKDRRMVVWAWKGCS